ncbi:hypothetical protein [Nonomuraea turkmeniaca]|uniref:hypothetical protein n=1 Tax=Nonomuraea turkmeniaca TaxID=103838 RepID=UPI001B87B15B|nr:hypothetical protein [Nonomuraea turkmeniaca]
MTRLSPGLGPLTPRQRWRRVRLQAYSWALTGAYRLGAMHPAVWRLVARGYHPVLDRVAARHARVACQFAAVDVPAYRDFLRANGAEHSRRLADFPETTKHNYAGVYDEQSRCQEGRLHRAGVIVDESSGSSGKPYNWVRGPRELKGIYRNAAGYIELVFPGERLFVINAYSMGAWATGTTTGAAMARIAMVKNTGPDLEKIADTLEHFGPGYDYVVAAYPPFLKHLRDRLDEAGFPWGDYRIRGMVGGEYHPGRLPGEVADGLGGMRRVACRDLADLLHAADLHQFGDREVTRELRAWLRLTRWHRRYLLDGLSDRALALSRFEALALRASLALYPALRPLGLPRLLAGASRGLLDYDGDVLVLVGAAGDEVEQGRVLMRHWLTLSGLGYTTHPLSQIIDCGPTRDELARRLEVDDPTSLLHVARVGRPKAPAAPSARVKDS